MILLGYSAGIVLDAFNLLEQPRVLPNFLYWLARMTDEQRGLEPTVAFASQEEAQLLRSTPVSGMRRNGRRRTPTRIKRIGLCIRSRSQKPASSRPLS